MPTDQHSPSVFSRLRGVVIGTGLVTGLITLLVLLLRPAPAPTSTALKPFLGETWTDGVRRSRWTARA